MASFDEQRAIPEMELMVLRCVIQMPAGGPQYGGVLALLASHTWSDHDHQVVFEVLGDLVGRSPQPLRVWLAAALTRKGFPDVDLNPYFIPTELTIEQLLRCVHELTGERA